MNYSLVTAIVLVVCASSIKCDYYKTCSSNHGKVQSLDVVGCSHASSICKLTRGTTAQLSLTFIPSYAAKSVPLKLWGKIGGVSLPFVVSPIESCGNYGLVCPLAVGKPAHFKLALPIEQYYPSVGLTVEMQLRDESGDKLACVEISGNIA